VIGPVPIGLVVIGRVVIGREVIGRVLAAQAQSVPGRVRRPASTLLAICSAG
jgi:hypothetical protein